MHTFISYFPYYLKKTFKNPTISVQVWRGRILVPEEQFTFDVADLGKYYYFKIKGLARTELQLKTYYMLLINSPHLFQLRNKYGLTNQLNFKNYWVDLHVTIGVVPRL